ncbi:PLP-dependent aminotransferase family protein [Alkanindiges sp. WGS2144]|uniref:aminotransferase-like domain-containing protein n=1 Tax=Alkanindiges sp. WGS2144 TaxID=3366808 RepID=UPI0037519E70
MKRYEQLAEAITALIASGVIKPGERVPSVRNACAVWQLSPSTVFKAYYLLEDRGLIQAREKSGYYVLASADTAHDIDQPVNPQNISQPTTVQVSDLIFSLLDLVRDQTIIPLGSAFPSPDLFPVQRLAKSAAHAMRFMSGETLVSDTPLGVAELRRQIAQRYALAGIRATPDDLMITTGAMEALNLCLQAVTHAGDYVAIESPAFYASLQVLERLQLKVIEIPVNEDGMDIDMLAQALQQYPIKACWLMSSFQNPTGTSLSDDKKRQLVKLISQHQIPLIEDDVYHELYFGNTPPKPAKAYDQDGWVMHCSSFSKSLAPGYRIGWVSAGRFSQQVQRLKLMTTISASIPAQAILADYLQHGGFERHLRKLRLHLKQQYQAMVRAIRCYFPADTQISAPDGGYFLWLSLNPAINTLTLFQRALAEGVSIAPGPMFSASQQFAHCMRLNYGAVKPEDIEPTIKRLAGLLDAERCM